jgi:hypothetical protein
MKEEQDQLLERLNTAVQEQNYQLGDAIAAVNSSDTRIRTRISELEKTVSDPAESQAQLRDAFTQFGRNLTQAADRSFAAIAANMTSTLSEGTSQLTSSLRHYLATETETIRQEVAKLDHQNKSRRTVPFLSICCVVTLVLQVAIIAVLVF